VTLIVGSDSHNPGEDLASPRSVHSTQVLNSLGSSENWQLRIIFKSDRHMGDGFGGLVPRQALQPTNKRVLLAAGVPLEKPDAYICTPVTPV
jgi:hypothetical protein